MSRIEDKMNISYRQLDHWCREGYLKPEGGNGTQRSWSEIEIKIGRMMSRLVAIGMTPSAASGYARSAVEDGAVMLLEFRSGKLRVRGSFSSAIRRHLERQQEIRDSRSWSSVDSEKEAC
jgi:hypothetical protein